MLSVYTYNRNKVWCASTGCCCAHVFLGQITHTYMQHTAHSTQYTPHTALTSSTDVCVSIHTHTHTLTHNYTHTHTHTHTQKHTQTHTHIIFHTYIHAPHTTHHTPHTTHHTQASTEIFSKPWASRRSADLSYEEKDTSMSYEEEYTCMSYGASRK